MELKENSLLGIQVTALEVEQLTNAVIEMIKEYPHRQKMRAVLPLDAKILTSIYGFFWKTTKNKELLSSMRKTDYVLPQGATTVFIGRLFGSLTKSQISCVDFIPYLAAALAKQNGSIFLLGSEEKIVKITAILLEALYPGLKIVGKAAPKIYMEGKELQSSSLQDELIIENINKAAPDVLILSFGSPKQEIWLNKYRHKIKVPVAIGVSSIYNLTAGTIDATPLWLHNVHLEWLYKFFKEPKKLWDSWSSKVQFLGLLIPLWLYHHFNRLIDLIKQTRYPQAVALKGPKLFLSTRGSLALFKLPYTLEENNGSQINQALKESSIQETILLDASNFCHASLEGLSALCSFWKYAKSRCLQLFLYNMAPSAKTLLKAHRLWDLFAPYAITSIDELIVRLPMHKKKGHSYRRSSHGFWFFESLEQCNDNVELSFLGYLNNNFDYEGYLAELMLMLAHKNCLCNLTYCANIETRALEFLLQLKTYAYKQGKDFRIVGACKEVRFAFSLAQVDGILL